MGSYLITTDIYDWLKGELRIREEIMFKDKLEKRCVKIYMLKYIRTTGLC